MLDKPGTLLKQTKASSTKLSPAQLPLNAIKADFSRFFYLRAHLARIDVESTGTKGRERGALVPPPKKQKERLPSLLISPLHQPQNNVDEP